MATGQNVDFPPIQNGMDYLISVMDGLSGDPSPRALKYAVLHLQAATEVLLKARLIAHDWRQVFRNPDKTDLSEFQRGNFQSCSMAETIERLGSKAGVAVSPEEKGHITHLSHQRNRLQHFGLTEPTAAIESRTALVLDFLLDFVHIHLRSGLSGSDLEHVDAQMQTVRSGLNRVKALVDTRLARIQPELDKVAECTVQCPACGRWAMTMAEGEATCRFCGVPWPPEHAAEEYAAEFLGLNHYLVATDGAELPTRCCPECGLEALVRGAHTAADEAGSVALCFGCGERFNRLRGCIRCGELIDRDATDTQVCDSCWEHALSRD
ncbi:hypothetical protein [Streptomyces carpaticus]|uniref:Uncharacterized protein n=1 Tax=Streptomyces carpaticus TaxID=285558 RepID=A0ABV4ZIK7_9ACTN